MNKNKIMYLDQGTYGCVYKPSFDCESKKKSPTKTIGKIFKETQYYLEEIEIEKIKKKMDPQGKFTIKKIDHCRLSKPLMVSDTCDISNSNVGQIIYEYGGTPLSEFMKSKPDIQKIISGMLNIANGLKVMKSKQYCHRDLKLDNILIKNDKMYIIDFGLMIPFSKVYEEDQNYVLRHNYIYYPPEFKIYYNSKVFSTNLSVISDLQKFLIYDVKMNYTKTSVILFDENQIRRGIRDILSMFDNNMIMKKSLIQIADKIDIFSYGIILQQLLQKPIKDEKKLKKKLQMLANECTHPNPFVRKDVDYVINELTKIKLRI
jgi:serine/threonine protein kinase